MKYQDQAIHLTEQAIDGLFRSARAVPEDQVGWKPLDNGRSVLDQVQECAQAPKFFTMILEQKKFPDLDDKAFEKAREQRRQWKTLDECEKHCRENTGKLFEVIRNFPEEDLDIKIKLPFLGGVERSLADMMIAHYTNTQYHIGQINYIQTLYGDFDPH